MKRIIVGAVLAVAVPLLVLSQAKDDVKRNQDVIRQHYESLNRGDLKAAVLAFAEDTKNFGRPVGREGVRRVLEDVYTTFPDWRMEILEMVAEGDSVVVRCTVGGTHRGVGKRSVNGGMLMGVEPTQKRFEVQHIHWYKLRDEKIVEHYATRDDIGMMRQLGLLPPVVLPNPK
ncbi:MAG: ester cyclase [Acidobacteria bacterium]|nr:ester cyclase [Acidobacteriota bacterium]